MLLLEKDHKFIFDHKIIFAIICDKKNDTINLYILYY